MSLHNEICVETRSFYKDRNTKAMFSLARSAFLFRPPPLSFVMNIFTLPFSRAVWLVSAALIALISLLLYSAFRWEFRGTADEKGTANWSDVLLLSLGAVCQQGAYSCHAYSSRSNADPIIRQYYFSCRRINTRGARRRRTYHFHHAVCCRDIPVYILLCLHCCFTPVHYKLHSDSWRPIPQRNRPGGGRRRVQPSFLFGNAHSVVIVCN